MKKKSFMARSVPVENLLPQNVRSIINYLQYTEVAQWGTPSCSRPQPTTNNVVRDSRLKWLVAPPPSWAVPHELHVLHGVNVANKSQDWLQQPGLEHASTGMPDQRTVFAATQGIKEYVKKESGLEIKNTRRPSYSFFLPFPEVVTLPRIGWIAHLTYP